MRHMGFKAVLPWCAIAILTACKSESPKTETPSPAQPNPAVVQLASKYEAITDWRDTLKGRMFSVFSIDIEHALIDNPGEKPILVVQSVQDVFRRDGEFWIRLSDWLSLPPVVDFELRCPETKLSPIFKIRDRFQIYGKFAVVAKVKKVRKIVLELSVAPISDKEAELSLEPPFSERFLATGECVEIAYVGKKVGKEGPLRGK